MVYPSQRGHFGTLNNLGNTQFSKFTLKDYPSTHRNKHTVMFKNSETFFKTRYDFSKTGIIQFRNRIFLRKEE